MKSALTTAMSTCSWYSFNLMMITINMTSADLQDDLNGSLLLPSLMDVASCERPYLSLWAGSQSLHISTYLMRFGACMVSRVDGQTSKLRHDRTRHISTKLQG